MVGNPSLMKESGGESKVLARRKLSYSNHHALQLRYTEEHIWMHTTSNLEADRLHQEKKKKSISFDQEA